MPCRDGRDDFPHNRTEYVNVGVTTEEAAKMVENAVAKKDAEIHDMEAAICAIFSEYEKIHGEERLKLFIATASVNAKYDLAKFWDLHRAQDQERLKQELSKYSKHEILLIKNILNNS